MGYSSSRKVVFLGPKSGFEAALECLGEDYELHYCPAVSGALRDALVDACAIVDASMRVAITSDMTSEAPNLKIISTATTGSDHIEVQQLKTRGIAIRTLRDDPELLRNITPTAELAWGLLLAVARNLCSAAAHVKEGRWNREEYPGMMLNGKILGVVGFGRLGRWVAQYGVAFGMHVIAHDPFVTKSIPNVTLVSLSRLVESADVISVHVHLSKETMGLLDAPLLDKAKRGAIVINTSRGGIVDEQALLAALESGHLGGAGLDVISGEPDVDNHPLVEYARTYQNLVITPHCGGYSPDAIQVACKRAAEKVSSFFQQR